MTQYDKRFKAQVEMEAEQMKYSAWLTGLYVKVAVSSVLSKKTKYPKEPYGEENKNTIVVTEDMSEEQKAEITNLLFQNLEEMQGKFENYKKQQTGES